MAMFLNAKPRCLYLKCIFAVCQCCCCYIILKGTTRQSMAPSKWPFCPRQRQESAKLKHWQQAMHTEAGSWCEATQLKGKWQMVSLKASWSFTWHYRPFTDSQVFKGNGDSFGGTGYWQLDVETHCQMLCREIFLMVSTQANYFSVARYVSV